MNPPDLIANKILEFLRPDSYDDHEEKLLKEKDEIKSGKIMIISKREKEK